MLLDAAFNVENVLLFDKQIHIQCAMYIPLMNSFILGIVRIIELSAISYCDTRGVHYKLNRREKKFMSVQQRVKNSTHC